MTLLKLDLCVAVETPDDAVGQTLVMAAVNQALSDSAQQTERLDLLLLDGWQKIGAVGFVRKTGKAPFQTEMHYITVILFKDTRIPIPTIDPLMGGDGVTAADPLKATENMLRAVGDKIPEDWLK